jgi:hypothetical protein
MMTRMVAAGAAYAMIPVASGHFWLQLFRCLEVARDSKLG